MKKFNFLKKVLLKLSFVLTILSFSQSFAMEQKGYTTSDDPFLASGIDNDDLVMLTDDDLPTNLSDDDEDNSSDDSIIVGLPENFLSEESDEDSDLFSDDDEPEDFCASIQECRPELQSFWYKGNEVLCYFSDKKFYLLSYREFGQLVEFLKNRYDKNR